MSKLLWCADEENIYKLGSPDFLRFTVLEKLVEDGKVLVYALNSEEVEKLLEKNQIGLVAVDGGWIYCVGGRKMLKGGLLNA